MSPQQISIYVCVKKGRPDINIIPMDAPNSLIKLMLECWQEDPIKRPTFMDIIKYLRNIITN